MAGKMKKAINFDLDTKKLKEIYCTAGKPLEYLKGYKEIKEFMKENGFAHRQWSGYVSDNPMSKMQVERFVEKMTNELPWLAKCVNKFDVTDIGKQYDMMKKILEHGDVQKEIKSGEKNAPKLKNQLKTSDEITKNLTTPEQEQNKAMSNGMHDMSKMQNDSRNDYERE